MLNDENNGNYKKFDYGIAIVAALVILALVLMAIKSYGADIAAGYTFTSGEQNVTHTKLNQVVGSAAINTTFFSEKSASTAPLGADTLLILENSSTAFRKATLNNLVFNNSLLLEDRTAETALSTNDSLLLYDASEDAYNRMTIEVLSNQVCVAASTNSTSAAVISNSIVLPAVTNAAVLASFYSLLSSNQVTDVSNKVGVVATELLLKNSSGFPYLATSVAVTADVTGTGANGREDGSADSADQWFYTWVIYNGTTVSGFLSTNLVPTLPSGYTYKALVGAVRNNATSDFTRFLQRGRDVGVTNQVLFTGKTAVSSNVLELVSSQAASVLGKIIPTNAVKVAGMVGTSQNQGWAAVLASTSTFIDANQYGAGAFTPAHSGFFGSSRFEVILSVPQDFYWTSREVDLIRIVITGFSL
jgi:hypothetical protein